MGDKERARNITENKKGVFFFTYCLPISFPMSR
jgi:hypothetical protein